MTVIDIHCHAAGLGAGDSGCFISRRLRRSWRYPVYLRAFGVTGAELSREGDQLVMRRISEGVSSSRRVELAVVLAMDGVVDSRGKLDRTRTEIYIPNDFVARGCRYHRNLLFGASVNPLRIDALERLEEAAGAGAVLVKWLPSIQGVDPGDRRLVPFYRALVGLGLPLLTHTGREDSFTTGDDTLADPARLRLPLEEGVTVIAAHCATSGRSRGEPNFRRLLPLFAQFPNLYADVSSLTLVNRPGHLQRVLAHREIRERLLYGSDFPLTATVLSSPWFHIFRLGPVEVRRLAAIGNPWDRDLELKLALGMPEDILFRAHRLLPLDRNR